MSSARRGVRRHGPEVTDLVVEQDRLVGTGGFLAIRRIDFRTRRADGSTSGPAVCDFVVRPIGIDAVVVAIYARRSGRVEVLLRDALRPALWFGRQGQPLPIPDREPRFLVSEVVAGIVEGDDVGEAGVRRRAADEVAEEAGFQVSPDAVVVLGAGSFPSPGAMSEKFWLVAVEVDPARQADAGGDGSPFEEGSATFWMDLDDAIAASVDGRLEDAKTELVLRRLKDHLAR